MINPKSPRSKDLGDFFYFVIDNDFHFHMRELARTLLIAICVPMHKYVIFGFGNFYARLLTTIMSLLQPELITWYGMDHNNAITIMLARIEALVSENTLLKQDLTDTKQELYDLKEDHNRLDAEVVELRFELGKANRELDHIKNSNNSPLTSSDDKFKDIAYEVAKKHNFVINKRIQMIKDLRNLTNCSLRDAKDMIDSIVPFDV